LLFGADTHLVSFDNSVLELRLDDLVWVRHQPASPPYSLRTDSSGRRRAGLAQLSPWPMHVYDAMVYDPSSEVLRVFSGAKHSFMPAPGEQFDPAWAYDPRSRNWRMSPELQAGAPNFFANAAVYDKTRDTIMAYAASTAATPFVALAGEDEVQRRGLWELGPERRNWQLANAETRHWGWFNAEFDQRANVMLVFGSQSDPGGDGALWVYQPGAAAGSPGSWHQRVPAGDRCPGGNYFPATYDSRRGLTLLLPPDRELGRTVSCLYDYARNSYRRLPDADLPLLGLNFTMVYASEPDLFVLVGGGFFSNEPTRVWVMKPAPIP
jgi:hypothetical protein